MGSLALILPLIQSAIGVLGAFKGSAVEAKATGYVQDATSVITALSPLVDQFANGHEVTPDDVKAALAGKDAALAQLDALIAAKGA